MCCPLRKRKVAFFAHILHYSQVKTVLDIAMENENTDVTALLYRVVAPEEFYRLPCCAAKLARPD